MCGKYCRIYAEFATKKPTKTVFYLKLQPIYVNLFFCLKAQDKMKSRVYKIKCTAASDQVLNCQPKIVILNNICHSVTITAIPGVN
jgi:hypothetical protein